MFVCVNECGWAPQWPHFQFSFVLGLSRCVNVPQLMVSDRIPSLSITIGDRRYRLHPVTYCHTNVNLVYATFTLL